MCDKFISYLCIINSLMNENHRGFNFSVKIDEAYKKLRRNITVFW